MIISKKILTMREKQVTFDLGSMIRPGLMPGSWREISTVCPRTHILVERKDLARH